jgi:hypothetical protein
LATSFTSPPLRDSARGSKNIGRRSIVNRFDATARVSNPIDFINRAEDFIGEHSEHGFPFFVA